MFLGGERVLCNQTINKILLFGLFFGLADKLRLHQRGVR